jgi:hypothetical protein
VTKPVAPALFQSAAVTVRVYFPTRLAGTALASFSDAMPFAAANAAISAPTSRHLRAKISFFICVPSFV